MNRKGFTQLSPSVRRPGISAARLHSPRTAGLKEPAPVSHRDRGYMPPLATSVVDREAVRLLHDWIKQLGP